MRIKYQIDLILYYSQVNYAKFSTTVVHRWIIDTVAAIIIWFGTV